MTFVFGNGNTAAQKLTIKRTEWKPLLGSFSFFFGHDLWEFLAWIANFLGFPRRKNANNLFQFDQPKKKIRLREKHVTCPVFVWMFVSI